MCVNVSVCGMYAYVYVCIHVCGMYLYACVYVVYVQYVCLCICMCVCVDGMYVHAYMCAYAHV